MSSIAHPDLPGDPRPIGPVDTASGLPFDVLNVSGSPSAMPHSSRRPQAGRSKGRYVPEGYEGGISPISGCHVPGKRYDVLHHPDRRPVASNRPDFSGMPSIAESVASSFGHPCPGDARCQVCAPQASYNQIGELGL